MSADTITILGGLFIGFVGLALLLMAAILVAEYRYHRTKEWRIDIRAIQLENARYLEKIHHENTRFFKSIGIKAEQIFERVDDPGWRD